MAGVFVSYRREDSAGDVLRIVERLKQRFPPALVFVDVANLKPGSAFAADLESKIRASDAVLVAIGPRWLQMSDARGRRIDNPDDAVRREIALALACRRHVFPLLLRGASMPPASELPEEIRELAGFQALRIDDKHFELDTAELCAAVRRLFSIPRSTLRRRLLLYRPHRAVVMRGWLMRLGFYFILAFAIAQAIGLPAAYPGYGLYVGWTAFAIRLLATAIATGVVLVLGRVTYRHDVEAGACADTHDGSRVGFLPAGEGGNRGGH